MTIIIFYFLSIFLSFKAHQIGLAIKIEEYVPDAIQTIRGNAKSLILGTNI